MYPDTMTNSTKDKSAVRNRPRSSHKRILTYVMKPELKRSRSDTCWSDIFIPAKRYVRMHAWNLDLDKSNGLMSKKQHLQRLNFSLHALPAQPAAK